MNNRVTTKIIDRYIENGLIESRPHPVFPLTIYNYTRECQYNEAWDDVTLSCRGLILDPNGKTIAKGFTKFFNYEERLGSSLIPSHGVSRVMVQEKMDGSLGILFFYGGTWIMATRGSFESDQAKEGLRIVSERYSLDSFHKGAVYLCEIIYPENRIVVDYGESKVVFLSAIMKGRELSWKSCRWLFNSSGIKDEDIVVTEDIYELTDVTYKRLKEMNLANKEGFVIKFEPSNFRVKIKFEEYVRLHKIMTNFSNLEVWEILRAGEDISRFLSGVPNEFDEWVKSWVSRLKSDFKNQSETILKYYVQLIDNNFKTRKEQAEWIMNTLKPEYQGLVFSLLDKRDISDKVWGLIKPKDYEKPFWS
jgi:hypothetical protein